MTRRVRTAGSLDPRSQSILRAVIEEYVDSATPVGSAALVERYRLGVSSATVRNILSDLEEAGLLTHPHTSAGRVPTDAGYRYFVESISDSAVLPPVEQLMIRHQFGQVQHASEQWFRLAATILAAANRTAAIVTPAKPRTAHVRRIDIVSISDRLASLIIVFREGAVRQVLVTLSASHRAGGPDPGRGRPRRDHGRPDGGGRRAGARPDRRHGAHRRARRARRPARPRRGPRLRLEPPSRRSSATASCT